MFSSCLKKQETLINLFNGLTTAEERYNKLIEIGRALPPYPAELRTPDRIVHGCQSIVYLNATEQNGLLHFSIHSEALISAGLAALLIAIYSGEPPEVVLTCPPTCIETLGIHASLSPGRSNGLASMLLRMKTEALKQRKN
jgi:cysteine desulfuration protein SufE